MASKDSCCCCFDLKNGALAIGITLLLLHITVNLSTVILFGGLAAELFHDPPFEDPRISRLLESWATRMAVMTSIFLAIHITFNSLLVHGARRSCRGMVLAWIIYQGILSGLLSLAIVIGLCVIGIAAPAAWMMALALIPVGFLVLMWYWFAVGVLFFRRLGDSSGFVYSKQLDECELKSGREQ